MIMLGQEKPSLEELIHFGVKGMKWGTHKQSKRYSTDNVNADFQKFGTRGVKRINERVKSGRSHEDAVKIERRNRIIKRTAVMAYGAFYAQNLVKAYGPAVMTSIVNAKVAKNGAKASANLLADNRGVSSFKTVNLVFNATKGLWEQM